MKLCNKEAAEIQDKVIFDDQQIDSISKNLVIINDYLENISKILMKIQKCLIKIN